MCDDKYAFREILLKALNLHPFICLFMNEPLFTHRPEREKIQENEEGNLSKIKEEERDPLCQRVFLTVPD